MNIEDIKKNFIALLRDRYDAKQYEHEKYIGVFKSLAEAWSDSDTDLIIGKKVLTGLGFSDEVLSEIIYPSLERDGILESYHKYHVDEEEFMEDFPYEFKVNKHKLFEGTGRKKVQPENLSYSDKDKMLNIDGILIPIKGTAQHPVLSILFSHFWKEVLNNERVDFIDIAKEDDVQVEVEEGIRWVENALRQVNKKAMENGLFPIFDLVDKQVRLCK